MINRADLGTLDNLYILIQFHLLKISGKLIVYGSSEQCCLLLVHDQALNTPRILVNVHGTCLHDTHLDCCVYLTRSCHCVLSMAYEDEDGRVLYVRRKVSNKHTIKRNYCAAGRRCYGNFSLSMRSLLNEKCIDAARSTVLHNTRSSSQISFNAHSFQSIIISKRLMRWT